MKIYLIIDKFDCYGVGKTSAQAWDEAKQYCDEGGGNVDDMKEIIFDANWPENAKLMDGSAWLNYKRQLDE